MMRGRWGTWLRVSVFCGLAVFCVAGCKDKDGGKEDDGKEDGGRVDESLPPIGPTGYYPLQGEVVRLTPEQISRQFQRIFGWTAQYEGINGIVYDDIVTQGVALGGIDYRLAFTRDPFPRIQTVLISRMLAWTVAGSVMWDHVDPARTPKLTIFTTANVHTDRPDGPGAERWKAQLEDLYWRLFARPPTEHEVTACRNAFLLILKQQMGDDGTAAWTGLLYALMSTMEFWVL